MSKEKAELVDRLNAIQRRIDEQGIGGDKRLEEEKEKILVQLDLLSKKEKEWKRN